MPADLTVQDSRQGIRRDDLPLYNVLAKSARFTETIFKVLSNPNHRTNEDIFAICSAQIKYLQDEYASLVVSSTFDPTVTKFFRQLQRNTGFSGESLEHLRSAATIAAVYRPQTQRGRGRGGQDQRRGGFFQYSGRGAWHWTIHYRSTTPMPLECKAASDTLHVELPGEL